MNFRVSENIPEMPLGHLFNDPVFHQLKAGEKLTYSLEDGAGVDARVVFYVEDQLATTGYRAPFGSVDFSRQPVQSVIDDFILKIIEELHSRGLKKVTWKQPPGYMDYTTGVEGALVKAGFEEATVEINQHIKVNSHSYSHLIAQKERNKLNRAIKEGYNFKILDRKSIAEAFKMINDTHNRKGYPVTISANEFRQANDAISGRYFLFGLYDEDLLIAVVASVRVNNNMLYNFYHADLERYRSRSPLVMLIGEVYHFCSENEIAYLDLGISTVEGVLNNGLFRFKENLGCEQSLKKTYVLDIPE